MCTSGILNAKSRIVTIVNGFGVNSTTTQHIHLEIEHFLVNGNGEIIDVGVGAAVEGYIQIMEEMGGPTGTAIVNNGGTIDLQFNTITTDIGIDANAGTTNLVGNSIICTTAIDMAGTAVLNLICNRITGTITTPVGTTYNFVSTEDGIDTKESFVGTTHSISNTNTDNTNASSHAQIETITGGASGGDPFLHLEVDSVTDYSFGIDNSDSDILKITDDVDPSTGNELYTLTVGGDGTYPQTGALGLNSGTTGQRPGTPVNGMIRYNSTTNLFEGFENGVWINFGTGVEGKLLQQVRVTTNTFDTATTVIPIDDTIPQNTEGDELFTLAITPTNASNILKFDFSTIWAASLSAVRAAFALFQDSTAAALFAIADGGVSTDANAVSFNFFIALI